MTATRLARRVQRFLVAEAEVIFAFICSRALLWVLASLALAWFRSGEFGVTTKPPLLWNLLFRWDANWYSAIAQLGYDYTPGQESRVAFFPLYPLLLRFVCIVTRVGRPLGGFLLSNACLLGAAILLRRLVQLDFPKPSRVPARTVWLVLLFPMTFFHSAAYSESLFLLLSIGAILAARHQRWAAAGSAGLLMTATRAPGLFIILPLLWELWLATPRLGDFMKGRPFRALCCIALVPLGLVAYAVYLHFRFGDALAFSHAMEGGWGRALTWPWTTIRNTYTWQPPGYMPLFLGTEAFAVAALLLGCAIRVRTSYLLYAAAMILLLACNTLLEALPRYVSVIFPLQIGLAAATARFEGVYVMIMVASAGLMALCLALFVGGYWMT